MWKFLRLITSLSCLIAVARAQSRLEVLLQPAFGEQALAFDTLNFENAAHQSLSVTRCDLLLSGAALQKDNGEWLESHDWSAFISLRQDRSRFSLSRIPAGHYTRLRFHIGLPAEINLGDPARYPAQHPLNPQVNGMHWGWQGGYVFAAMEGLWRSPSGVLKGYSFHLANEANLMTLDLPVDLDLAADRTLKLRFDLKRIFEGVTLADDTDATHSREGDVTAARVKVNLEQAFRVLDSSATPTREEAAAKVKALIGSDATPYRFHYPARFPRPSLPADNPLTEEGVRLGERLFHEELLSGNETQSCATCHRRREAFSDLRRFSMGAFGDIGTRQSMPLFNLAWKSSFFWDGRAATLREQSLQPITNEKEMHASLSEALARITEEEHYTDMFEDAFGTPEINADRVSRALEQYLLTLVSSDSKFDRSQRGEVKLTAQEQRGAALFNTEYDPAHGQHGADCFHCHGGPTFRSLDFANNGLDAIASDTGLAAITKRAGDTGKFAVPSLRNVALTAPYMHDGRFETLEQVVDHYDHGVTRSETLDPNLAKHPDEGLRLSKEDKDALVAYLKTLTDYGFIRPPDGPPPPPPPH